MLIAVIKNTSNSSATAARTSPAPTDMAASVETEWYSESVNFCMERGMIKPNEGASFDPNALLSKIEFITMISRAYGLYDEGDQPFYLAKDGHYAAAVQRDLLTEAEFPQEDWARPLGRLGQTHTLGIIGGTVTVDERTFYMLLTKN